MMISDEDLIAIAEEICESLFEQGPDLGDDSPADDAAPTLTAVVDIAGDWTGRVSVRCRRPVAQRIASVMFAAPVRELTREDVIDALGEVANMAAGAVKGMLDGEKTLGLPTVDETDFDAGNDVDADVAVDYPVADGNLRLAVHQAAPAY